ncbi:MAG: tRNA uridine-5-carboxymethylaminomethyl(34) synthesis GTPase MnmE [Gammaproteobacteria bacterium]|nr:tRNA uridine-5-carboxymethylaminomethyl(34) synthesis GTPase MnmE [Gammaproteobacteria bacterium]
MSARDTIAAQATPSGKGGIGVIRVSGTHVKTISEGIIGSLPIPRIAKFTKFTGADQVAIDHGLALYFPAPNSFTGEDILELQGHGGPVVMNLLLTRVIELGARLARPGEFSERAFLNNKIDLSQAEAVADLIESASTQAARSAIRSLSGEFAKRVNDITDSLIASRVYIEAAMDFPEEEIDFLKDSRIIEDLECLQGKLSDLLRQAGQGALLREGVNLVFAGRPNAGKSSLMNRLTGKETSIVTDIAGTTRDVIDEHVHMDGIPVRLVDTAGLRDSEDILEKEGVRRAVNEITDADYILVVVDLFAHRNDLASHVSELMTSLPDEIKKLVVLSKSDLCDPLEDNLAIEHVTVSAKTGEGINLLKQRLKSGIGYDPGSEGTFMARTRHLHALQQTILSLDSGLSGFRDNGAGELLAEELRYCQRSLGEITGEFTSDDLLGKIFSSFCVGK